MSDYQGRLEDARRDDAALAARRRALRINAGLLRRAGAMDAPPPYLCVVCGVDLDTCKCELGE